MDGVMEAEGIVRALDGTDMLLGLQNLQEELMNNEDAPRGTHRHHIFPKEFKKTFIAITSNTREGKFSINKFAVEIDSRLHLAGLHQGGRKFYNGIWNNFLENNKARLSKDPMFMIGFGLGLINKLGFGGYDIVPCKKK